MRQLTRNRAATMQKSRFVSKSRVVALRNWKLTKSDEAGYRHREIDKRGPPPELTSLTSSLCQHDGRDKLKERVLLLLSADEPRLLVHSCSYTGVNVFTKLSLRPRIKLLREPSFLIAHFVRFQKTLETRVSRGTHYSHINFKVRRSDKNGASKRNFTQNCSDCSDCSEHVRRLQPRVMVW